MKLAKTTSQTKKIGSEDKSAETTNNGARRKAKATCFTIMPFGGWFDDYYEDLYCPAIRAADLEPCRADDLYRPSTIINDVWIYTQAAK